MAISRTLFDLKPRGIENASELADKLRSALIDTLEIENERDRHITGKLWSILSEYDRQDIPDSDFFERVRSIFPD